MRRRLSRSCGAAVLLVMLRLRRTVVGFAANEATVRRCCIRDDEEEEEDARMERLNPAAGYDAMLDIAVVRAQHDTDMARWSDCCEQAATLAFPRKPNCCFKE
jgi:hypothetical protein